MNYEELKAYLKEGTPIQIIEADGWIEITNMRGRIKNIDKDGNIFIALNNKRRRVIQLNYEYDTIYNLIDDQII